MKIEELYALFLAADGISIDTREIRKNQLFFALKGKQLNGNALAAEAIEKGASYAIIEEEQFAVNNQCIIVKDVLKTLQQLAHYHLKKVQPKAIIAITGSNGKTTTKELVNAVLATTYQTHYTKGNLNNHIGIPLTLLAMSYKTEIAIIEMGANHQKEIEEYCTYVEPTHGIITNCGKAHLEGFGSIEGIRKGKGELFDFLKNNDGTVLVNGDDTVLMQMIHDRVISNYITYGNANTNNYYSNIEIENPFLKISFEGIEINTHLFGSYNYSNIMCAIAFGKYFNVTNDNIKLAIEQYQPTNARSQVITKNGNSIILDSYNANPTSMQHALESFAKSSNIKKVVVLGDMFELGGYAAIEHQKIADLAQSLPFDKIVLVGNEFYKTDTHKNVLKFKTTAEAQQWFSKANLNAVQILLKGSRSMKMEKIIE